MILAQPLWLLLLLPVLGLYFWRQNRSGTARMPVSRVRGHRPTLGTRLSPLMNALKLLILILLVLALAGPRVGQGKKILKGEGIDIVLAVDISKSMSALLRARDGTVLNRLNAVKTVVRDFVEGRPGDRLGLVAFGSYAYTQLPLTLDHQALLQALDSLQIGSAGQGTAVGDAVGISLKRLQAAEAKSQVVILLTDGSSNTGELSPMAASQLAADAGIKVYCIGVGVNSPALEAIAKATEAKHFLAWDTDALAEIYTTIDTLERHEIETITYTEYKEYYAWCLALALGLLGIWLLLSNTRFLRIP